MTPPRPAAPERVAPVDPPARGEEASTRPRRVEAPPSASPVLVQFMDHWDAIVAKVCAKNRLLGTVLDSAEPESIDDGVLTLRVPYAQQKSTLEDAARRRTIEDILHRVTGAPLRIACVAGSEKANVTPTKASSPRDNPLVKAAINVFGAKIVEG